MKIVLIGFMCSGKSSVGRIVAKKLGWDHYDTDAMISRQVGVSIAEVIKSQGEAAFRDLEEKTVRLLGALDKCVISTGGGVPLNETNMKALGTGGEIVWLKVKPETVLKRAGALESRPLIDQKDPLKSIRQRMAERETAYGAARHVIDTDSSSLEQIAEKIVSLIPAASK